MTVSALSLAYFFIILSTATAVSINFRNFSATAKPSTQNIQAHLDRIGGGQQQHHRQSQEASVTISPVPIQPELPPSNSTLCNVTVHRRLRHTWLEAFRACKELGKGTELVSIKSEEDYQILIEKIKEGRSPVSVVYWTSGTDLVDESVYVWMSDGSEVESPITTGKNGSWWAAHQPDNLWETEHCIALRRTVLNSRYEMSDENCLMSGAFICAQRC